MVMRSFRCNPSRLKGLLDDDLPEREHAELVEHLDTCPACQRRLNSLAAESRWWSDLRRLALPRESSRPTIGPIRDGVGETASIGAGKSPGGSADGESLDFLARSDDPRFLGRLGPYGISEVLGRGGMGVVLRAFDPVLDRSVAIKVLAPQLATSAAARRRFDREARAAAAVVHDHVTAIHAIDVDGPSGLPYLVMPYLAGRSLQERIDRDGPLEVKEILRIGMQAAAGLAAAHAQGLVHRDVKPSNILLENGVERVKITDFGLARAIDDASLTQSGVIAGTPQYMSPEQARGEPVDARSDLFSLGSVLYAMAAGRPPFRAASAVAVLRRVSDECPRPLREINPEIPGRLAAIIEKLHAKDPAGRYQSAPEVAEVLGRFLAELQRGEPFRPQHAPAGAKCGGSKPGRRQALLACVTLAGLLVASESAGVTSIARLASAPWWPGRMAGSPLQDQAEPSGTGGRPAAVAVSGDRGTSVVITDEPERGADDTIVGSGTLDTKAFEIVDFTAIDIRHPFRIELTRADDFKVSVTADENVLGHVKVAKEGPRLKVALEDGKDYRLRKDSLKVAIALPSLEEVGLRDGAFAMLKGFKSRGQFKAEVAAASTLEGEIESERIVCHAAHGSRVALDGSAGDAQLAATASSTLDLGRLVLRGDDLRLELEHGSSASINVRAKGRFEAKLQASSTLRGAIEAGDIAVEAAHGSRVALSGSGRDARLVALASSTLDLGRLDLRGADVRLEHGSTATVDAESKLDYTISSSSTLKYLGSPTIGRSESSHGSTVREERPDRGARRPSEGTPSSDGKADSQR